jgi:hypothetical protein
VCCIEESDDDMDKPNDERFGSLAPYISLTVSSEKT